MQCCVCKEREAKVHLTQIVGEKMQKVDLCEECAKQKGVTDPSGFQLADLLLGLGASQEMEQAAGGVDLKCPHCGFTQADFKKAGRLGCSECYNTFAEGLEGLLKSMHKGVKHVGKSPQSLQQSRDLSEKLKSLQKKLDKAVAEEDFELAAVVRDEIKTTKEKLTDLAAS
ncbi:MAG: UvrB/UvrC motif-containing protein [Verrucomicrobia subdivision 3 bacterium]|nr:UvrB/UvrC motif-containing protein [Limisphaerales bacterium]